MAEPVEIGFDFDKTSIIAALPEVAESLQASLHGIHEDHGLTSIRFSDGKLVYLHIMQKDSKTVIRFAPDVSYLGEKETSVIPQNHINKISVQLRKEVARESLRH